MNDKTRKRVFIGILAATFLLLLLMNILTPMLCDDYMYSFSFATGERITSFSQVIPSLVAHGQVMNGRYSPHFVVQSFLLLPSIVFDVVNSLVYIAFTLGLYRMAFSKQRWNIKLLLLITGALFVLPAVFGQDMLWMAGAANYLWPATGTVYLLYPFASLLFGTERKLSVWAVVALAVGGLLVGNANETLSAAVAFVMGLCILYRLITKQSAPLWMWLTTACVVIGWLFLVLSPADTGSIALANGTSGMAGEYMKRLSRALTRWRVNLMGATIGYIAFWCIAWRHGAQKERLLLSLAMFAGALLCCLAMVMSNYYPERTLLCSLVLLLCACAVVVEQAFEHYKALSDALVAVLCFMMAFNALNALPNSYDRYKIATARDQEMAELAAAGETDVVTFNIPGRTSYDGFYGLQDVTDAANYTPNVNYAKYFGLNSVVIDRYEK